jgi:hypothetical protein
LGVGPQRYEHAAYIQRKGECGLGRSSGSLSVSRVERRGGGRLLPRLRRRLPVPPMARLGARSRRPAEPFDGDATPPATRRQRQRQHHQMGTRVMAWWCARVVAPVRRACRLAVAAARARVRKAGKRNTTSRPARVLVAFIHNVASCRKQKHQLFNSMNTQSPRLRFGT